MRSLLKKRSAKDCCRRLDFDPRGASSLSEEVSGLNGQRSRAIETLTLHVSVR